MAEVNVRKNRFNQKLDKIKQLEESGELKQKMLIVH